jgi:hypothetical protein
VLFFELCDDFEEPFVFYFTLQLVNGGGLYLQLRALFRFAVNDGFHDFGVVDESRFVVVVLLSFTIVNEVLFV